MCSNPRCCQQNYFWHVYLKPAKSLPPWWPRYSSIKASKNKNSSGTTFFFFFNSHVTIAKWKKDNIDITCQALALFIKSYTSWTKSPEGSIEGWSWWASKSFSTRSCHFCALTTKPRCVILEYLTRAVREGLCWSGWHWLTWTMAADRRLSSLLSYTSVNQKEKKKEKKKTTQKTQEINGKKQKRMQDLLSASDVAWWGL